MSIFALRTHAHPMDLAAMDFDVGWTQVQVGLRLHVLAVDRILKNKYPISSDVHLNTYAQSLFAATIGQSSLRLRGETCAWRKPTLIPATDGNKDFLEVHALADCPLAQAKLLKLDLPLPFLLEMPSTFHVVAKIHGVGEPVTLLANAQKPKIDFAVENNQSFGGFLRLGMGHIGALPEEWRDDQGNFKFPEGLDHIYFVLALIVGGGALWELIKCVSGFTVGHSLTLALATFNVIHVHSHWVEALIALSIAYVSALALFRPSSPHRWLVAMIFGTVHGLGFASALQDIELTQTQLLPALFGFNMGVEIGQCAIIFMVLPLLLVIKHYSNRMYYWTVKGLALGLFLVGSYWFILRALN